MAFPSPYGPQPGNQFGAGSLSAGTSGLISAAGGLGSMRGVPSGRSSMDPSRLGEQAIRQMRSKGNFGGAYAVASNMFGQQQEQQKEQAGWSEIGKLYQKMTGQQPADTQQPQTPDITGAMQRANVNQAGWGLGEANTGSREGNIAAAKQAGTFGAIVDRYNQVAKGTGKMMDASGNIVDAPAPGATPAATPQTPGANYVPNVASTIAPGIGVKAPPPPPVNYVTRR